MIIAKKVFSMLKRNLSNSGPLGKTTIVAYQATIMGPMQVISEIEETDKGFIPWVSLLWDDKESPPFRVSAYRIKANSNDLPIDDADRATNVAIAAADRMKDVFIRATFEVMLRVN